MVGRRTTYRPRHTTEQPAPTRRGARTVAAALLLAAAMAGAAAAGTDLLTRDPAGPLSRAPAGAAPPTTAPPASGPTAPGPPRPEHPSRTTALSDRERLTGDISPKSVEANGHGLVLANNMMYQHTVTLYDAEQRELVATVPDAVQLADHGIDGHPGTTEGAPVEAAWTDDGAHAYVSQYRLYGEGHGASAGDDCSNGDAIGESALFRLDAEDREWDQVIEVGRVPKFVALSPDDSTALVSNWCDETVSVVDLDQGRETMQIPVDAAPRGIVVLADNRTAYVTAMYADELYRLDLVAGTSELVRATGDKPRHLVLSPDGATMYLTESGEDRLVRMDARTAEVLDEAETGREPRTMEISPDGTALYIVNYYEDTVSKFDAATLEELQREDVGPKPIGVTYEPTSQTVWVANYSGSLDVFDDSEPAEADADSPD